MPYRDIEQRRAHDRLRDRKRKQAHVPCQAKHRRCTHLSKPKPPDSIAAPPVPEKPARPMPPGWENKYVEYDKIANLMVVRDAS